MDSIGGVLRVKIWCSVRGPGSKYIDNCNRYMCFPFLQWTEKPRALHWAIGYYYRFMINLHPSCWHLVSYQSATSFLAVLHDRTVYVFEYLVLLLHELYLSQARVPNTAWYLVLVVGFGQIMVASRVERLSVLSNLFQRRLLVSFLVPGDLGGHIYCANTLKSIWFRNRSHGIFYVL